MPDCSPRDCIIDPIKAGCIEYCVQLVTQTATVEEKVLIFGLRPSTANAIFRAYNGRGVRNFDDLRAQLRPDQVNEIRARFLAMSPFQRAYFQLDRRRRQEIIDAIKRAGFNLGDDDQLPLL